MKNIIDYKFPKDFIFGAATSSYQIEGENYRSDWYNWEKKNHNIHVPCGKACNSWDKYEEDIKLLKEFNLDAYRMSLEWGRIFPNPGKIDFEALKRYHKILGLLKENNINIFLTIQHHTLPAWLKNGWLNKKIELYFGKYVELAAKEFSDYVSAWMPINEPAVNCTFGYFYRQFPPGQTGFLNYIRASRHQGRCHYIAYQKLKEINPAIPVGFVKQMILFKSLNKSPLIDRFLTSYYDFVFNDIYLFIFKRGTLPFSRKIIPGIQDCIDFWGLNYYTCKWVSRKLPEKQQFSVNPENELTQMGWEWRPDGLIDACNTLINIKKLPIYITENGIATEHDGKRKKFIYQHLLASLHIIESGIPLKGYFYWSLLDNFEWCMGYTPKFGLAKVDRSTFERTPKPSGYYLGKIAQKKELINFE